MTIPTLTTAVIRDHAGRLHLEAAISDLTACGHTTDLMTTETIDDAVSFDCPACGDAVELSAQLVGRADDLRVLAGAALLAADRLDPAGGHIAPDDDQ